ncbi:hypothetical protein [Brevibacillus brevis]|uniref:hypothetical protein n=1 Tax=Brevibacillus brevis TaxID=1393 RepID=UPI001643AC50|nr:hypothetical protein [Brevibacillus brevis]
MYETLTTGEGWGEALTLLKYNLDHGLTYGVVPRHDLEIPMTEQYAKRTDNFTKLQQ